MLLAQLRKRPAEDEFPALFAPPWADLHEIVRRAHHSFFVFDDEQRVAFVAQAFDDADEPPDVARMQADAWFIKHEQRVYE